MKREPPVQEHRRPSNPTTDTGSGRADGDYNISIGFWQPPGAPAHVQRGRLFLWARPRPLPVRHTFGRVLQTDGLERVMPSERSKKPALGIAEGNLVPQARNGMLREVYPELSRRTQHDRLDRQD
jgi:hypothetical protein